MSSYSIVAICQVYNELEKGNLERFFRELSSAVDAIVIFDDASTDGSYEYCLEQTPHVIRGTKNAFVKERSHKQKLLRKALELKPDFILWMDADEVLSHPARKKLQKWCAKCIEENADGVNLHQLNLWRSESYRRVDSFYDDGWFTRLWRVTPSIAFNESEDGLHQRLIPDNINKTITANDLSMIHFGFASDEQIAYKYFTYKKHGQRGYVMLDRLIDESNLSLERVSKEIIPPSLRLDNEAPPVARTMVESFEMLERYRASVCRPKYSIVCLIYKSTEWLQFVYNQVLKYTDLSDCEFFFIANDPEPQVAKYLRDHYIPHFTFHSTEEQKKEWHINRVYRAYNFGAEKARGDFLVFINSDMAFSHGWLDGMIAAFSGTNCVASRLVESGKLRTGTFGIEKNFGKEIEEYREEDFTSFAHSTKSSEVKDGGLFMPLMISKRHFMMVGGYPEGNIVKGSDIFNPVIAKKGEDLISGDNILMQKLRSKGVSHQTAWDSVIYHFQAGELDQKSISSEKDEKKSIAIINDLVTGTVGERVLWDYMLENLPLSYGVDQRLVGKKNFDLAAKSYIDATHPNTEIIVQNATFIGMVDANRYTIAFLQDDLRRMKRDSVVQEANLEAATNHVTNSIQTAASYPEYDFTVIPVGLDESLFTPQDQAECRVKYNLPVEGKIGIFVGSFSEVKGWSQVVACIEKYQDIHWICVSKYDELFEAPNATVFTRIEQEKLVELLNASDFFLLGSPVETQCLAALEAGLCDKPIIMPLTGIFVDFTQQERDRIGIFTNDLQRGVQTFISSEHKYSPRETIIARSLTVTAAIEHWWEYLSQQLMRARQLSLQKITNPQKKYRKYRAGMILRKKFIKPLIGREYFFPSSTGYTILRWTYKSLVKLGLEPIIRKLKR